MSNSMFNRWYRRRAAKDDGIAKAVELYPATLEKLQHALQVSPLKGTCPVRTLRDMSEEEIQALEQRYNCYCHRPSLSEEENTARRRAFKRSEP